MSEQPKNQQRTAIIYFGPTQQDYQNLVEAEKRRAVIDFIQSPLQQQLGQEFHRHDCACTSHYTVHQWRDRSGGQTSPQLNFLLKRDFVVNRLQAS